MSEVQASDPDLKIWETLFTRESGSLKLDLFNFHNLRGTVLGPICKFEVKTSEGLNSAALKL